MPRQRTTGPSARRIPTLDGWRGIAILLVLADHFQHGIKGDAAADSSFAYLGQHGVTIFFVLSGYLITSNLLHEKTPLLRFYVRRFFRLMPAAWIYLTAAWLLNIGMEPHANLMPSLLFYRNYVDGGVLTGHFWTLSIEEQFYIFWPVLLFLLGRRAWIAAAVGTGVVCVWRISCWTHLQGANEVLSFPTQFRADALFIGCLLAFVLPRIRLRAWLSIPALTALAACFLSFHKLIPTRESILVAVLLGVTVQNPTTWLARLLRARWLVGFGLMSYSIYLWQEFSFLHWGHRPLAMIGVPCSIFGAAWLSYRFIERPSTNLGRRLTSGLRDTKKDEGAPDGEVVPT